MPGRLPTRANRVPHPRDSPRISHPVRPREYSMPTATVGWSPTGDGDLVGRVSSYSEMISIVSSGESCVNGCDRTG